MSGEGMVREFGVDIVTRLYLKWIANKDLLCSGGNSAECYVAVWMAEEWIWGRTDTSICMVGSLCCPPKTITTLLIDYTPIQNKKFKKIGREKTCVYTKKEKERKEPDLLFLLLTLSSHPTLLPSRSLLFLRSPFSVPHLLSFFLPATIFLFTPFLTFILMMLAIILVSSPIQIPLNRNRNKQTKNQISKLQAMLQ